ncbi:MAG: hypothetical protein JOZ36_17040 [Acidobacteria bacterium]|nr:hypothetical protein [Acidobacteriota bacterium]
MTEVQVTSLPVILGRTDSRRSRAMALARQVLVRRKNRTLFWGRIQLINPWRTQVFGNGVPDNRGVHPVAFASVVNLALLYVIA